MKGRSNYSLLHHLTQYVGKLKPDLLTWPDDMPHLRDGHTEFMNEILRQISALKERLGVLESELKEQKNSSGDPFSRIMTVISPSSIHPH